MRSIVVTLGLSLLSAAAVDAQTTSPLVVTPAPAFRTNLDFGLAQALKKLPEGPRRVVTPTPKHSLPMPPSLQVDAPAPVDCAMVKKHQHGPLALRIIPPPTLTQHQLKTAPVTACPVR
jgi:hypothetical protein